jgi:hypothetical protein
MAAGVVGARLSRGSFATEPRSFPGKALYLHGAALAIFLILVSNAGLLQANIHYAGQELEAAFSFQPLPVSGAFRITSATLPDRCPGGSSVFVYGYANELYSYYNWNPASEFLVENWAADGKAPPGNVVKLLVSQLKSSPPRCIVQAVGPAYFGDIPASATLHEDVPALSPLLRSCYRRQVTTIGIAALGYTGESGQTVIFWYHRAKCTGSVT